MVSYENSCSSENKFLFWLIICRAMWFTCSPLLRIVLCANISLTESRSTTTVDFKLIAKIKILSGFKNIGQMSGNKKAPHRLMKGFLKVGRAGFEPTKALPTDLQSAPFDRFGISPFIL